MTTAMIITWTFWGFLMLIDQALRTPAFIIGMVISALLYAVSHISVKVTLYSAIGIHLALVIGVAIFFMLNWKKPNN